MRRVLALAVLLVAPAAMAADRYGPEPAHLRLAPQGLATRTLSWPGKVVATTSPSPSAPIVPRKAAEDVKTAAALPTSLYSAPPVPTPAPQRLAQAAPAPIRPGPQARLYSVHREYGLSPDAIAAPPAGSGYVLIGPPDRSAAAAPKDEAGAPGVPF